jgi:cytidylate kinase
MEKRKKNHAFDIEVDEKLIELVKKGNVVITSYTLPWLVDGPIKLWLKGSTESRAKRMAKRDNISEIESKEVIYLRDKQNKQIYKDLYGFEFGADLEVFDFILNTDILSLESLIYISKNIISEILNGNRKQ